MSRSTSNRKKMTAVFAGAAALCLATALASLMFGAANLSPEELWQALRSGPKDTAGYIFWYVRLPRTAACLFSGGALALSGCIIQAVLGNQLASPGIIGVNAGAGLAVTMACALGMLSGWAIAGMSFAGAMASVFLVMFLAKKTGASRTTVILSGVALNSILNALSEGLTTLIPEIGMLSGEFRVGGFSSVAYTRLIPAGILILLSMVAALTLCSELDVLTLGEDTAQSLGLSVKKIRSLFLILAAMLAGASVSFAGLLGFVGLIVPHMARRMVGSESRLLLPFCILGGAGVVTLSDLIARTAFSPYELPVGILLSVLGGPFFLFLLIKKKGGRSND